MSSTVFYKGGDIPAITYFGLCRAVPCLPSRAVLCCAALCRVVLAFQCAAAVGGTVLTQRESGDLRVHAAARCIHIQLRVAVLRKSPAFRGLRSASPPTAAAHGTSGGVRRHGFAISSGSSARTRSFGSSSRHLRPRPIPRRRVGGMPPPCLAGAPRAHAANRPHRPRSTSLHPPRSRLTFRFAQHSPPSRNTRAFLKMVRWSRLGYQLIVEY